MLVFRHNVMLVVNDNDIHFFFNGTTCIVGLCSNKTHLRGKNQTCHTVCLSAHIPTECTLHSIRQVLCWAHRAFCVGRSTLDGYTFSSRPYCHVSCRPVSPAGEKLLTWWWHHLSARHHCAFTTIRVGKLIQHALYTLQRASNCGYDAARYQELHSVQWSIVI